MDKEIKLSCVDCGTKACLFLENKAPEFCTSTYLEQELLKESVDCYENPENSKVMIAAAGVEYEFYCQYTRVQEIIEFAKRMEVKKIGIATCVGLLKEARIFANILRKHGFEVVSIACKCGHVKKVDLGIDPACNAIGENICNPILQAKYLNKAETDLNVVMGLCVGHDSLFYKYVEGLTTTFIVKDRVLGHNPAAALYMADGFYSKKL